MSSVKRGNKKSSSKSSRNLHENLGITSIYITHDPVEAMTLSDRLIVMKDGYAEQIGKPLFDKETGIRLGS